MSEVRVPSVAAGDGVRVTLFVAVSPADAFEVFTAEVDAWWRHGRRFRSGAAGSTLAFEHSGADRQLVERRADGTRHVFGRVLIWQPGERLVFEWRGINFAPEERTEVEVCFFGKSAGTEVVLVHRGWSKVRADHPARHGLEVAAFARMMGMWWGDLLGACREHARGRR